MRIGIYPTDAESKGIVERQYGKPVVRIRLERLVGTLRDHPHCDDSPGARTSPVVGVGGKCVVETLNTIYVLEEF
jgi:hypothetical protein